MSLSENRKVRRDAGERVTLNTEFVVDQAVEALDTFVSPVRVVVDAIAMSSRPLKNNRIDYAQIAAMREARREALRRKVKGLFRKK